MNQIDYRELPDLNKGVAAMWDMRHQIVKIGEFTTTEFFELNATAITDLLTENQALRNAANGFKEQFKAAEARAEKAERERDAVIKDIKQNTKCYICKHYPEDNIIIHCKFFRKCGLTYANWEWRGLEE